MVLMEWSKLWLLWVNCGYKNECLNQAIFMPKLYIRVYEHVSRFEPSYVMSICTYVYEKMYGLYMYE